MNNIKKGLLVSYPLFSHNFAMRPYLETLLDAGFQLDYFNTPDYANFIEHENMSFRSYESYKGLGTATLNKDFSIYKLGLSILESFESTKNQIEDYIKEHKPDFIIHPKFGFIAKVLASKYGIPVINLTSGFVFNPDIVFNFYKDYDRLDNISLGNIFEGKVMMSKYERILESYGLTTSSSNDLYVNEEDLHVVMNTPEFQPDIDSITADYKFLGMSFDKLPDDNKEDLIYVSLGTVFNKDLRLFWSLIRSLEQFDSDVVIYANIKEEDLPQRFRLAEFGKQEEYLQKAKLFITHGGACSILESLFYKTPMIVIPQTIEHEINGNNVVKNKFGLQVLMNDLTEQKLLEAIHQIYNSQEIADVLEAYNTRYDLINNKYVFVEHIEKLLAS